MSGSLSGARRCGVLIAVLALVAALLPLRAGAQGSAVRVASGLSAPTYVASPPNDSRLFIVEQTGTIRVLQNGVVSATPFLDISDRTVNPPPDCECGLLGLVFADDYAQSGVFYVYYMGDADPTGGFQLESRVARFTAANPASSAPVDPLTETILFRLNQPAPNHNGGTLAIRDHFLYLGLGDGGGSGDPQDRAQKDTEFFGKMLRFDMTQQSVPWTPEKWAKGFRNPYRYSFDSETGDLYIGDVGQATVEEIDVQPASAPSGLNYGWDVMEGSTCFSDPDGGPDPGEPPCNDPSLILPVYEYDSFPVACAVVGGTVYRGNASPSLRGLYFFSDLCTARIWTLRWNPLTGAAEDVTDRTSEFPVDAGQLLQPVAIAPDAAGELYVVSFQGSVFRLVPEPATTALGAAALSTLYGVGRRRRAA